MHSLEELHGTIEKIIFESEQNGFVVFTLNVSLAEHIVVRCHAPGIKPGELVNLRGTWTVHPRFGKQFHAQQCTALPPTSSAGLKKYLASGLIPGIGPVYAEKLVDRFGSSVLEIIDKEPHKLSLIGGIGKKRIERIATAWKDQKEISHIMVFLQEKGISAAYATKIYKKYGNDAIALVTENPYRLAQEVWGIGFKTADAIAQSVGIAQDSLKRVTAGILYALSQAATSGHLYMLLDDLRKSTAELLEIDLLNALPKIKHALHNLHDEGKIKLITHNQCHFIALALHYASEKGVAQKITSLMEYPLVHRIDTDAVYEKLRTAPELKGVSLNEDQQRGIMNCLLHKITVITGGPGTGKTTLIKQLLSVLDEQRINYKLAAPTGRAAKRMSESTHRQASTLHRLLEFDVSAFGFSRNEHNALQLDMLIVDEASMIDIFLAHAILKALPLTAHLVLIGDVDQLPPVGPGNFLRDVIASKRAATVKLTHIFRQAQDSLIIRNAHRINQGEFPASTEPDARKDYIFIKEENPELVSTHLTNLYKQGGLARYGIDAQDSMVLTPMNRGIVGTQHLNGELQTMLNAHNPPQVSSAGTHFRMQDRVMQVRNNYDKNVFNGDIGTITEIDSEDRTLSVLFIDRTVMYEASELDELVLAYAISVHKSQGSEYGAVIITLFAQHFTLLQRNLLYTAITRARKLCILIGQPKAIAMAVKNTQGTERVTFLSNYLTSDLQCY
jgi:exodeoxyribonuclease V alpha subunit